MTSFLDFWGSGHTRMRRLAPSTRLVCGGIVFASCLISPVCASLGCFLVGCFMFVWIWLCGLPWKMQVGLLLYAILLFSPFFLFTPWLETTQPPAGYNWFGTAKIPLEISLRGTACIFVSASTIAVLDLAEFNVGLASLPIPPTIRHLLIQIVHQTAMLTNESQRISSAVQIRGLPSGFTPRLKFLSALPTIWLLRIMHRADRIAAAMDLRGFENTPCASRAKLGFLDGFAMFTALLLLGATITMRWMEVS